MYRLKKKHQDLWKQISVEYMTEESDSDAEEIKQHKLQWRSESKNLITIHMYILYVYYYCRAEFFDTESGQAAGR